MIQPLYSGLDVAPGVDSFPVLDKLLDIPVGNTPLLSLGRISSNLFGKAEFLNPTGSVKDRAAHRMLLVALKQQKLGQGREVLDSTSGNTGISLAAFCASIGVGATMVLPKSASEERQRILRLLGVHLIHSDPLEGSDGAMIVARDLARSHPSEYYYIDQYSNDANWQAHYYGTAEEIWKQTGGKVTHFVAGVGTGGTITGTGRRLRELNPSVKIIAVEPATPLHGIEGLKHIESSIKPLIFDQSVPDDTAYVETEEAQRMTLALAREQGLLVGTSSGATTLVAKRIARESEKNVVVAILADQAMRYLSEKYMSGVGKD